MKRPNFSELPNDKFLNGDILNTYISLRQITGIKSLRFNSTLGQLIEQLKPYANALSIDKCITCFESMQAYEQDLNEIREIGTKEEIREFIIEHDDLINEFQSEKQEYEKFLTEPFEPNINFVKFKKENIPDDISSEIYLLIAPFVKEEIKEE